MENPQKKIRAFGGKGGGNKEKLPPAPVRGGGRGNAKKETATRLVRPPSPASPSPSPPQISGPSAGFLTSALIGGSVLLISVTAWVNKRR